MNCRSCRESAINEEYEPDCINGRCPTGFDQLPPKAVALLQVMHLLDSLHEWNLADRICDEYGVTFHDLKIMAEIRELSRELNPAERREDG